MVTPTKEQQDIIDYAAQGNSLIIQAFSGASKTTTLCLVAKELDKQGKKGLYLAFNKAIAEEAKEKMPDSVYCSTVHSLAFRNSDRRLTKKINYVFDHPKVLADNYNVKELKIKVERAGRDIDVNVAPIQIVKMAKDTIANYCNSSFKELCIDVVVVQEFGEGSRIIDGETPLKKSILKTAKALFKDMVNVKSKTPITHDTYLKLYSLDNSNKLEYDYVMVDENQDTNPCTLMILDRYKGQKIIVGDTHQAIYAWRNAINAMDMYPEFQTLHLTKSFRFGDSVEKLANEVLQHKGCDMHLYGNGSKEDTSTFNGKYDVYIARTNQGALSMYISLLEEGRKPYLDVNKDEIIKFVKHYFSLGKGWKITNPHQTLYGFESKEEVKEYTKKVKDRDLEKFLLLCDMHGYSLVDLLKESSPKHQSDCCVMTAHKSKGLEFDNVLLGDDFDYLAIVNDAGVVVGVTDDVQELNLLYVAVTRAKKYCNIGGVTRFFKFIRGEYEDVDSNIREHYEIDNLKVLPIGVEDVFLSDTLDNFTRIADVEMNIALDSIHPLLD